jgi:hypothetical protein
VTAPVPAPIVAEDEEYVEEDEEDEEISAKAEISPIMPQKPIVEASKEALSREQQIMMEIEMLQNNGRYRAELLNQLQEINKALVVIAGVLVDLSNGKPTA